jgi:tetratricopeptide (TPR) repeat protein
VGTFALVFAAIAVLFAIDTVLAEKERAETRSEARRSYLEGLALERQGAILPAIDQLRSAVSAERENPVYQRALATALTSAGKLDNAVALLNERLQRDPGDAAACLIMARALVRSQRLREAITFYHRAIYGRWDTDPQDNQVQARFELVELLAQHHARQEMLAELLPLQNQAPRDVSTRKRLAHLFIAAGSPARAIELYRDILRQNGDDADAYAGLGEAEFQRGNYRAARTNYLTALKLAPEDREIGTRLELCNEVLALDPTQRGIGTSEQYRRSLTVLQRTVDAVTGCPGFAGEPDQALEDRAHAALSRRVPAAQLHDAVEQNLELAEQFWETGRRSCLQPMADSIQVLKLVLEKAAQ